MARSTIDLKSLLIGLLLGLCVMFAVGAQGGANRLEPVGVAYDPNHKNPSVPVLFFVDGETNVVYSQSRHEPMQQVLQFGATQ